MRIGLFGGSFDPFHKGHLALITQTLRKKLVEKIIVIPAYLSPHKTETLLTPAQRLEALKDLASDTIEVSDFECSRPEPSWSIHTITHFESKYPDDQLFWILGTDSFESLPTWKQAEDICEKVTFIVANRGVDQEFKNPLQAQVILLENDVIDVSSSQLKGKLLKKCDVSNEIPEGIALKIKEYL